ncbi:MAG: response regulator [Verrucomicrobiota bacterium]
MSDTLRILVVEDNPADADLIRELLPESGPVIFQTECVSRLAAALDRLETPGIDLILLDLGLPDSQGLVTFQHVRRENAQIPVIVLSGMEDDELALAAVREGAQDYLSKRLLSAYLLSRAVRYAVERKQAELQIQIQLDELRQWQGVMLGREERNIQLKREVNELLVRLGEPIRYPSQEP